MAGKTKKSLTGKVRSEPTCDGCGECCHYVALEIDRPRSKRDYSDLFWHLLHKGVAIYIGHDRSWNMEFITTCVNLTEKGMCGDYDNRPVICREYSLDNCTRHSDGKYYLHKFQSQEEFKAYLRSRKVDFEFKRKRK